MYGLVNRAIEELVIATAGKETWNRVKQQAGVTEATFISMHPYPDEMTYSLVGAASEILEVDAAELLRGFGKHWILFTANEGYGSLLDMAGDTLRDFLMNLDALHARLGMSMPDLQPPSFRVRDGEDGQLTLLYYSERDGLAPMVVGLLEGLGERFSVDLKIEHQAFADRDEFHLDVGDADGA